MNYGEIQERVFALTGPIIDRTAEETISDMAVLADTLQKELALKEELEGEFVVNQTGAGEKFISHTLPSDFDDIIRVVSKKGTSEENQIEDYQEYNGKVYIPGNVSGEVTVEYTKVPQTIGKNTAKTFQLEISEKAQLALCFGIAGQLLLPLNRSLALDRLNEYEDRKSRLGTRRRVLTRITVR